MGTEGSGTHSLHPQVGTFRGVSLHVNKYTVRQARSIFSGVAQHSQRHLKCAIVRDRPSSCVCAAGSCGDLLSGYYSPVCLGDILDGLIARALHLTSELGAFLDSLADITTMFLTLVGVLIFQKRFVAEHTTGLLSVIGLYVAEIIASLWRYGRISSFHTVLARVAAFMGRGLHHVALYLGLSRVALPKDCHHLYRGSIRRRCC